MIWARKRLDDSLSKKTDLAGLEEEKKALSAEVDATAAKLSKARKDGAEKIERLVMEELRHLSMKGVTIKIVITDRDRRRRRGPPTRSSFSSAPTPGSP